MTCVQNLAHGFLYAADFLGDALKAGKGLDDSTIASGLKDALSVGK